MAAPTAELKDLVVQPDSFLYMQNEGKGGAITVHRGPTVVNQTGQDQPMKYKASTRTYETCTLEQAVQICQRANEGDYVVLENPSENGQFPTETSQPAKPLKKGRKTVIPGPWSEALWPGQSVMVIPGHRLRTNQYLVAIVYNAEEAAQNWDSGTIVKQQVETTSSGEGTDTSDKATTPEKKLDHNETQVRGLPKPENLSVGTRIVIRGSDVSFYIPCTGVEVMKDDQNNYVREAVTLEQLEYCCLVDESGKKEYPHGPKVVFPRPTQVFEEDRKKRRKFSPIELNNINGIHLKVTAGFSGPDIENNLNVTRDFKEGEELFVTGKTLSIYYPREELAVIEYGQGNKKHYSTAIPKGEGRYVINRQTGSIVTKEGPNMFLADPRSEIPVRRILSEDECKLWYPGNTEAILYNKELAIAMSSSPSGRSGMISEGDYRKHTNRKSANTDAMLSATASDYADDEDAEETVDKSIRRGTKFTQPRTITLNTKYDGVPKIEVWPGYAVLVLGSKGERKVVEGPQNILLEYDQKLGFMDLSTGTPKKSDKTIRTAYLCVHNNQVGDIVPFESKDHVKGKVRISLRVNFESASEADKLRWFSVDNYVKFLTDHVRSVIGGMAKKNEIGDIKTNYVTLIRDVILGAKEDAQKRAGLAFEENGMRVVEVEVLELTLDDAKISKMLDDLQTKVVQSNIELATANKDLEVLKNKEQIEQVKLKVVQETSELRKSLQKEAIETQIELITAQIDAELSDLDGKLKKKAAEEAVLDMAASKKLVRDKADAEQVIGLDTKRAEIRKTELDATTDAAVKRFESAKNGLYEVLVSLGRDEMAAKLAQACTIERWLSGDSVGSSIGNLLSVAPTLKAFFDKAEAIQTIDPTNRLKSPAPVPVANR